jgi:hypothetical protein
MALPKYKPLGQEEACEDLHEHETRWSEKASLARAWKTVYTLFVLLAIAITFNVILLVQMRDIQAQLEAQSYGTFPADECPRTPSPA